MSKKIGFIGCGNMAYAMISGMVSSGNFIPSNIKASNRSDKNLERIRSEQKIRVSHDNRAVAEFADIIILSVKPKMYETVIEEIKDLIDENKLIITIAAGISIDFVEKSFGKEVKVIRTMPNTPALVHEAMTAISYNQHVNKDEINLTQEIFNSFGITEIIDEELMDVVTAVSGSSPAIVYMLIEALADGAVLKGLSRDKAYKMVSQAVLGAAKMVNQLETHPGKLKDNVTSAGGTSIEAIYSLEKKGFRGTLMESVEKATEKSILLSEKTKK